ncbi:probable GDP-fucose transporter [Cyanidioschyzon merolae strain 10D]|jgi:GDP-fucose transporter C1|uniref:Probable GDP-fucose transporter n=1 Tax=Cyanidioschyzon merolae (strain NIES-3377 / 10D) TaxID=280699 RepID=M1VMP4_CYAM1|nr:probable GDP-fucose transporter [Cyanidioschyzon merolae strain 10D]BAM83398.1 probable GDP-fucose transporter [Cyanidioschyzon merolae strain 10D]|eukprot:XP_005539434.1 probable GDP-fucose transporter [Cyanidioschyzon merolae strain 10D]
MDKATIFNGDDKLNLATKSTRIAVAVASYWIISIAMVFLNKAVLSQPGTRVDAPLFVTWYQCLCTVVGCYVLGVLGIGGVPRFEVQRAVLWKMLPLSAVFVAMTATNNVCLKYVEVSFYQVARSLTVVFNVLLDFLILGQRTSLEAMVCLAVVIFGYVLGNDQEVRWSLMGVLFGLASSFFVALNSIFVKKNLAHVDNNPWKLTLYNNLNATVLFVPLILLTGEVSEIFQNPTTRTPLFWTLMSVGGMLGIAISFAAAAQIKWTSPLTHNVSCTAKAAAQTFLALLVYRNPITVLGLLSIFIVLGGSLAYTMVRRSEMIAGSERSSRSAGLTTTAKAEEPAHPTSIRVS